MNAVESLINQLGGRIDTQKGDIILTPAADSTCEENLIVRSLWFH